MNSWKVILATLVIFGAGVFTGVLDFHTLGLADGRVVRLVGVNLPPHPLVDRAKEALSELVLGRPMRMWFSGTRVDRYGRLLVLA